MVDESVVKAIKVYLRAVQKEGIPVKAGVLFGSYATGKTHEWSDIDLLVISPRFDNLQRRDIDLLWYIAAKTDSRIEPIAVGEKQFAESHDSMIIEIARREGQIIPLAD
jgi:predicted nucleotidyltransferase